MELTSTNSPCVLFLEKNLPSLFQYICQISLVAIEERVHPTPFRTRKLSSPSPMILHNVMWESRPLPKIVRDPLAAHSARGSFLSPVSASCVLAGAWTGRYLLVLACIPLRLLPDACGVPACRMGRGRSFVLAVMQVSSTVVHNRQGTSIACCTPALRAGVHMA